MIRSAGRSGVARPLPRVPTLIRLIRSSSPEVADVDGPPVVMPTV
jgi:hypothetical protein